MSTAPAVQGESIVAARDLRVACGDDLHVVEVKLGEAWPEDARGRLDVLIRTGQVVRFDENGVPDKRSWKFVKRLGLRPAPRYMNRTFEQRSRAEALKVEIAGRRVRVFAGRPDGELGDLFVVSGRAYVLRYGTPDEPTAAGARSRSRGAARNGPRRRPSGDGQPEQKRRRRKRPRG